MCKEFRKGSWESLPLTACDCNGQCPQRGAFQTETAVLTSRGLDLILLSHKYRSLTLKQNLLFQGVQSQDSSEKPNSPTSEMHSLYPALMQPLARSRTSQEPQARRQPFHAFLVSRERGRTREGTVQALKDFKTSILLWPLLDKLHTWNSPRYWNPDQTNLVSRDFQPF